MKKYKIFIIISLSIISSLFLTSNVKADTYDFNYISAGNHRSNLNYAFDLNGLSLHNGTEYFNKVLEMLYTEYEENYKSNFPYYYIAVNSIQLDPNFNYSEDLDVKNVYIDLFAFKEKEDLKLLFDSSGSYFYINGYGTSTSSSSVLESETRIEFRSYWQNNTYFKPFKCLPTSEPFFYSSYYFPLRYFISNLDLYNSTEHILDISGVSNFTINPGDKIEPMYTSYEDYINGSSGNSYVEVNLNDYPYIALSLKDYSKTEEFTSMFYVQGQFCLTPVYNYGQTEKKDIISGSQNQRCSLAYDTFTPIRTYILKSDLENNAIYYLKAYDTTIENKVKIDTSIFNIHYITEDDKDNPILTINGRDYTPKSYDELTDTSTKSEDENYGSGVVCTVGDLNCTRQYSSFSWSDIFDDSLDFLKGIWDSIVVVFEVIIYFISILPSPLQSFLYFSFMLAIILGLIKIIL